MSILAVIAVSLAVGTWLGIRWAEASRQMDDLITTVLSTPLADTPPDPHLVDEDRWRWN